MRRKKIVLVISAMSLLSGCSALNDWVAEKSLEKSGITNSAEYQNYLEYKKIHKNEIDDSGRWKFDTSGPAIPAMAEVFEGIHITASENDKLNVQYFLSKELATPININEYHAKPNDIIYVSSENADKQNNLYEFSKIRVWDIGSDGNKTEMTDVWDDANMIIHIPEDYTGSELAIEPLGMYMPCKITFEAYTMNENEKQTVSCNWKLDGLDYNRTTAELDPVHAHNISMNFDNSNYYYNPDDPDENSGFTAEKNSSDNAVYFNNITLTEKESNISLRLRKYINCSFFSTENNERMSVKINNDKDISGNEITKLKTGDKITIDVKDGYKAECIQQNFDSSEPINGGTRYSLIVPEISANIQIYTLEESDMVYSFTDMPINHATTISVISTNYVLKPNDNIPGSEKIRITVQPDKGYKLQEKGIILLKDIDTYKAEMKYSDYLKKRNDIILKLQTTAN